jgi:hypothetical protein
MALCLLLSLGYVVIGTWLAGRLVASARRNATLSLT